MQIILFITLNFLPTPTQIQRVKELKDGTTSGWVITSRAPGEVCYDDPVSKIPGIGKATRKVLENEFDIFEVHEVECMLQSQYDELAEKYCSLCR